MFGLNELAHAVLASHTSRTITRGCGLRRHVAENTHAERERTKNRATLSNRTHTHTNNLISTSLLRTSSSIFALQSVIGALISENRLHVRLVYATAYDVRSSRLFPSFLSLKNFAAGFGFPWCHQGGSGKQPWHCVHSFSSVMKSSYL